MPEFPPRPETARRELRRAVREPLRRLEPNLRVLAEDVLGEASRIDLLAVDSERRPVVVLIVEVGEDLAAIARVLALRAWVGAHARDWNQLAPDLDMRPESGVRSLILCGQFQAEAITAADSLGTSVVELVRCRRLENGSSPEFRLEPHRSPDRDGAASSAATVPPPPFRCGLTDEDFAFSPTERADFE